jgi:hypothetical protein
MRIAATVPIGMLFFSLAFSPTLADEKREGDYWTKDGKLLHTLEIEDASGGIAHQGTRYVIETDGAWTVSNFLQGTPDRTQQGALAKHDLGLLVEELTRYDLKGLNSEGQLVTNANSVTIKSASLHQNRDCDARAAAREEACKAACLFWLVPV